jgi:hypothetical protein
VARLYKGAEMTGYKSKKAAARDKLEDDDDIQDYKKPWVGLTDEDCDEVERWVEFKEEGSDRIQTSKLIRYIEAKLKEKNNG